MPDPAQSSASPPPPRLPLADVLPAIASERRWSILRELAKGEPLPVIEVAHRLRATPAGTSKHFAVLLASGIVLRTYGGNYTKSTPASSSPTNAPSTSATRCCASTEKNR